MTITEQTENRLIVEHHRFGTLGIVLLFTVMSIGMFIFLLMQGLPRVAGFTLWQWIGWGVWLGVALLLIGAGVALSTRTRFGTQYVFDRHAGTLEINSLRQQTKHSIYSIASAEVQFNPDVRVYGIFLVLRSGERLALGTLPPYDEQTAYTLAHQVTRFLKQ